PIREEEKQTCKTEGQIAERSNHQPNAQEAGPKARPLHQEAEWDEPQPPKYLVGQITLVVQAEKQHGECVALRLVKYGQEIAAAREPQGGGIVHCVDKEYRHLHQAAQDHHQHSERMVDYLKQSIKSQRNEEPQK